MNVWKDYGFKSIGEEPRISEHVSIRNRGSISIGNHVRIDDFCILTGNITIGDYVHIGAHSCLFGRGGITLKDFSAVSGRVSIYSTSDDFSGDHLLSTMVPDKYTKVHIAPVTIDEYCVVGAGSVVLPGVHMWEGTALGALSFAKESDYGPWLVYAGIPAARLKSRSREMTFMADEIRKEEK